MAQKQQKNFIQQLIERYGDAYITSANPREVSKKVKSIFKDIAFGNIDVERYKDFISAPIFIENAIAVIDDEFARHQYHLYAINLLINQSGTNEYLTRLYYEDQMKRDIYSTIRDGLYAFKQTNDFSYICAMQHKLKNVKEWRYNL